MVTTKKVLRLFAIVTIILNSLFGWWSPLRYANDAGTEYVQDQGGREIGRAYVPRNTVTGQGFIKLVADDDQRLM